MVRNVRTLPSSGRNLKRPTLSVFSHSFVFFMSEQTEESDIYRTIFISRFLSQHGQISTVNTDTQISILHMKYNGYSLSSFSECKVRALLFK
jgi:hypothetical protein